MKNILIIILFVLAYSSFAQETYDRIYIVNEQYLDTASDKDLTIPSSIALPSSLIAEYDTVYANGCLDDVIVDVLAYLDDNSTKTVLVLFKVDSGLVQVTEYLPIINNLGTLIFDSWYEMDDNSENIDQGVEIIDGLERCQAIFVNDNMKYVSYKNLTFTTSIDKRFKALEFVYDDNIHNGGTYRNCKIIRLTGWRDLVSIDINYNNENRKFYSQQKHKDLQDINISIVNGEYFIDYQLYGLNDANGNFVVDFYKSDENENLLELMYSDTITELHSNKHYRTNIGYQDFSTLAFTVTSLGDNENNDPIGTSEIRYLSRHAYIQVDGECTNKSIQFKGIVESSCDEHYDRTKWCFDYKAESAIPSVWEEGNELTHTYLEPGKYTVAFVVSHQEKGCWFRDTVIRDITIKDCNIKIQSPEQACIGESVNFETIINYSDCEITSFVWNFGDKTIIKGDEDSLLSVNHRYLESGSYIVQLEIDLKCGDDNFSVFTTKEINIESCLEIQAPNQACIENVVEFEAILEGYSDCDITYEWYFGDGTNTKGEDSRVSHNYSDIDSYVVKLTIHASCDDGNFQETTYKKIDIKSCSTTVSNKCKDCIGTFSPLPLGKYLVSAWVKEDIEGPIQNYEHSDVTVICYNETWNENENRYEHNFTSTPLLVAVLKSSGQIIDGWQKIEQVITIPEDTKTIEIQFNNKYDHAVDVFFDDIRFQPFNSTMKSYVYDFASGKLKAENDENNYATFYEYDEEGNLVRVKKETVRGIMTIQESRNSTKTKK